MATSTRKDLEALRPSALAKFRAFENDVLAESRSATGSLSGVYLVRTETLRTRQRQAELYAIGRDAKGNKVGATRTDAKPGQSIHEYGGAGDYQPVYGKIVNGQLKLEPINWNWDRDPKLMAAMRRAAELAERHGLEWGGHWSWFDGPHFQVKGDNWRMLQKKYPQGWVPGVSRE
jgi:hypothetical protein